jgi:hypothetical protein
VNEPKSSPVRSTRVCQRRFGAVPVSSWYRNATRPRLFTHTTGAFAFGTVRRSPDHVWPPSMERRTCSVRFAVAAGRSPQATHTRRLSRGSTAMERSLATSRSIPMVWKFSNGTLTPVTTRCPLRPSPESRRALNWVPPAAQSSSRATTTSLRPPARRPK